MANTCYMCSKLATKEREHAPPLCFFPERKDLKPGENYRKQLITVPSCDDHNSKKCHIDEYLLFVVVSHFQNNEVAANQFLTKIFRTIQKFPDRKKIYTQNIIDVNLNGENTMAFEVDMDKFKTGMDHMARALYFKHYKDKWLDSIRIESHKLLLADNAEKKLKEIGILNKLSKNIGILFENDKPYGANPNVFYYQVHRDFNKGVIVMSMVFYNSFKVTALSVNKKPRTNRSS